MLHRSLSAGSLLAALLIALPLGAQQTTPGTADTTGQATPTATLPVAVLKATPYDIAVALRIESHNHPSAIEPYQGAATGVGGIIRDIFSSCPSLIALKYASAVDSGVRARLADIYDNEVHYTDKWVGDLIDFVLAAPFVILRVRTDLAADDSPNRACHHNRDCDADDYCGRSGPSHRESSRKCRGQPSTYACGNGNK